MGHLIDWYNVKYFGHPGSDYDSYEKLFLDNTEGTAIKNLVEVKGMP